MLLEDIFPKWESVRACLYIPDRLRFIQPVENPAAISIDYNFVIEWCQCAPEEDRDRVYDYAQNALNRTQEILSTYDFSRFLGSPNIPMTINHINAALDYYENNRAVNNLPTALETLKTALGVDREYDHVNYPPK